MVVCVSQQLFLAKHCSFGLLAPLTLSLACSLEWRHPWIADRLVPTGRYEPHTTLETAPTTFVAHATVLATKILTPYRFLMLSIE